MAIKLDKKDKVILMELQENCKQSSRQLSRKLGIPATTIHQRIRRLVNENIITGFTAIVDPVKVGLPTTAIVLVRRTPKAQDPRKTISYREIGDAAAKLSEISEAHVTTGDYDMLLKVRGRDEREVGSYIVDKIWNLPGVERTITYVSMYTAKDTPKIDIP